MSESEWVTIPDAVTSLPIGTVLRHVFGGDPFELTEECQVAETDRINYQMRDDLGDTPEHLKPLLRAARERVPGTVIQEEHQSYLTLWMPERNALGWLATLRGVIEHELGGFGDVSGIAGRYELRTAIEQGRCYPTTDARRIGREEFGLRFEGDSFAKVLTDDEANQLQIATGRELNEIARLLGTKRDVVVMSGRDMYETDATLRARLQAIHAGRTPNPTKVLTSPITWGDVDIRIGKGEKAVSLKPFNISIDLKPTKDAAEIIRRELDKFAGIKRTCACGSTTNVNLRLGVCAACHLEKRKAEVWAEMDRPVPKKCEESGAPRSWPEGAGDDYEL